MKKRILCYGDSNTWGNIPGGGECARYAEDIRWTGVLQQLLGNKYQIIEEGYNGRTTVFDDIIEHRLSGLTYFLPCIAAQSPLDLIIIMLGTNDLKRKFAVSAKSCTFGLKQYLDALGSVPMAGQKPQVLIVSPLIIEQDYKKDPIFLEMYGDHAHEQSLEFSAEYKAFAIENHLAFFDAAQYAKASSVDGIHMTPEGHAAFARAISGKILSILN